MEAGNSARVALVLATCVLGALALFSFAAAGFLFISDDFVIGGKVVSSSDIRIVACRDGFACAGWLTGVAAWLCHRRRRLRYGAVRGLTPR